MHRQNCPVLAAVVEYYERTADPVTPTTIARAMGREEEPVANRLEQLTCYELLTPSDEGYRPTVTGREFLALDVECGPLIVDADDCE